MIRNFIIFINLLICVSTSAQSVDEIASDFINSVAFGSKKKYYQFIGSGDAKFNQKKFKSAEQDYLIALDLLEQDSAGKITNPSNYAVGKLTIYNSLWEVNEGLKDKVDEKHFGQMVKFLEKKYAEDPKYDISPYFEKRARRRYLEKNFKMALKDIQTASNCCKNKVRKKSIDNLKYELTAINYFNSRNLESALKFSNILLKNVPDNTAVLDLRGKIYFAMGKEEKACADWEKAFQLNYAISGLRINKYCYED